MENITVPRKIRIVHGNSTHCSIPGCTSSMHNIAYWVTFHSPPQNEQIRNLWKKAVAPNILTNQTKVCSYHFRKNYFRVVKKPDNTQERILLAQAYPTKFLAKVLNEPVETMPLDKQKIKMKNFSCCVMGCKNNYNNVDSSVKFHSFPLEGHDLDRRTKWIDFVRKSMSKSISENKNWTPSYFHKICSQHFIGNDVSVISPDRRSLANCPTILYPKNVSNDKTKSVLRNKPITHVDESDKAVPESKELEIANLELSSIKYNSTRPYIKPPSINDEQLSSKNIKQSPKKPFHMPSKSSEIPVTFVRKTIQIKPQRLENNSTRLYIKSPNNNNKQLLPKNIVQSPPKNTLNVTSESFQTPVTSVSNTIQKTPQRLENNFRRLYIKSPNNNNKQLLPKNIIQSPPINTLNVTSESFKRPVTSVSNTIHKTPQSFTLQNQNRILAPETIAKARKDIHIVKSEPEDSTYLVEPIIKQEVMEETTELPEEIEFVSVDQDQYNAEAQFIEEWPESPKFETNIFSGTSTLKNEVENEQNPIVASEIVKVRQEIAQPDKLVNIKQEDIKIEEEPLLPIRRINSKENLNQTSQPTSKDETTLISGRRIVDLSFVISWCLKLERNHAKTCPDTELRIVNETEKGLVSDITFRCDKCDYEVIRSTESSQTPSAQAAKTLLLSLKAKKSASFDAIHNYMGLLKVPSFKPTLYSLPK